MFDETIKFQIVEETKRFFTIVSCGAQPDHIAYQLLVNVHSRQKFLTAIIVDLPTAFQIINISMALNKRCVADYVGLNAKDFSHFLNEMFSFIYLANFSISK